MDTKPTSLGLLGRRSAVERALSGLPLLEREAVCLCLLAKKSTAEVSQILGVSRAQVARLVARGLTGIASACESATATPSTITNLASV